MGGRGCDPPLVPRCVSGTVRVSPPVPPGGRRTYTPVPGPLTPPGVPHGPQRVVVLEPGLPRLPRRLPVAGRVADVRRTSPPRHGSDLPALSPPGSSVPVRFSLVPGPGRRELSARDFGVRGPVRMLLWVVRESGNPGVQEVRGRETDVLPGSGGVGAPE